ncbi:MAG: hypothetical protein ACOC5D_01040, partial [Thermoplasmatota archaeon]
GDIGAEIKIDTDLRADTFLFSESNTRWLIEVDKNDCEEFEDNFSIPVEKIGTTHGKKLKIIINDEEMIDLEIDVIREKWKKTLAEKMG